MLQLFKNQAVVNVSRKQVEVRQLEVDWYVGNYGALSGQAAMLAGFGYGQLTTSMPTPAPNFVLEVFYMTATAACAGISLFVIAIATFLSVWGPGLALRGQYGAADLHSAIDSLRDHQIFTFSLFIFAWLCYLLSAIAGLWIYFDAHIAGVVSIPMILFFLVLVAFTYSLTRDFATPEAVHGRIDALQQYEFIGDLDRTMAKRPQDAQTVPSAFGTTPVLSRGYDRITSTVVDRSAVRAGATYGPMAPGGTMPMVQPAGGRGGRQGLPPIQEEQMTMG